MRKERLSFDAIYPSGPHYARGVRAGNLLFISGCTANNSPAERGAPMDQLRVVLDRITRMVSDQGGQPADVVKLTTFVTNPGDWFPFEGEQVAIYHEFFADDYPANTIVGARFPTANVHLEIDAITVLD